MDARFVETVLAGVEKGAATAFVPLMPDQGYVLADHDLADPL